MPEAGCQAMEGPLKCLASTQTLSPPDFARSASRATIAGDRYGCFGVEYQRPFPENRQEPTCKVRDRLATLPSVSSPLTRQRG